MKLSKLASAVFAVLGTVLLVGSIGLCMVSWSRPVSGIQPPEGAEECARAVLEVLDNGDFFAAAEYFAGQPELGLDQEPATPGGKQLWDAYRASVVVEAADGCYSSGTEIYQDAAVTAMDLTAVMAQLNSRAAELLKQRLEAAEDPAAILGEAGEVSQQLRDEVRTQALTEALADRAKTVTRNVTLKLVQQDGQWWVLPDAALLEVLSAGLG